MAYIALSNYKSKGNALAENVLKDKIFSNDNGVNLVGTMPDNTTRTSNGNVAGVNQNTPNNPVRDGSGLQIVTNTDNQKKIVICPPQGFYQGNDTTASYVSEDADVLGSASSNVVLSGKTFSSENGISTGSLQSIHNTTPRGGRVGYYSSGKYGYIGLTENLYKAENGVNPEVRLNHNQLFNLINGNIADLKITGKFAQWGSDRGTITQSYSYTSSSYIPRYMVFVFFACTYTVGVQSYVNITAKINNIDQALTYDVTQSSDTSMQCAHCICKIQNGDVINMSISNSMISTAYSGLHAAGIFRIETSDLL